MVHNTPERYCAAVKQGYDDGSLPTAGYVVDNPIQHIQFDIDRGHITLE